MNTSLPHPPPAPFLLQVPDDMKTETEYEGTVTFTNPLAINVTNGVIHLEGASVASAAVHEFG